MRLATATRCFSIRVIRITRQRASASASCRRAVAGSAMRVEPNTTIECSMPFSSSKVSAFR
jgi:hypothetical protein